MSELVLIVVVIFLLFGAITGETYLLVLGYLMAGAYLLARWWPGHSLKNLSARRDFTDHVFPGEVIPIRITIKNHSLLPVVWLAIRDLHPIDLSDVNVFKQVITLSPKKTIQLRYFLKANHRGYFPIGPMTLETSDLFGWTSPIHSGIPASFLTVYPTVIPLRNPFLPSNSPLGLLPHTQPLYEDPNRVSGKRDYQQGDPLRKVDWKATASQQKLQVKTYEPSTDLETVLFLNLDTEAYHPRSRFDGPELAIVAAASVAAWSVKKRQAVGLITNGLDILNQTGQIRPIAPRKGKQHLMRLLELLARVKTLSSPNPDLNHMINQYRQELGWGTTLFVLTGSIEESLIHELRITQRMGLKPIVILCGWFVELKVPIQNGMAFEIPVRILNTEEDLKAW